MSRERPLTIAAIAVFVVALVLMIPFEDTLTRILGVLALFAFVVLGVFAIATPERLAEPGDGAPDRDERPRQD